MEELISLEAFVLWFLTAGFSLGTRFIVARIKGLQELDEAERGLISTGISSALVAMTFVVAVLIGALPAPDPTLLAWVSAAFPYVAVAAGIPLVMTSTMRAKYAAYGRKAERVARSSGGQRSLSGRAKNELFGIKW